MLAPRRSLSRCSGVSLHSEDHQVIPSRNSRDDKLWGLLPSRDSPYEYGSLSRAETDAFVEALADGFGEVWIRDNQPLPLPIKAKEKSGLLEHYFFSRPRPGYDTEEWDDAFWDSPDDDDAPAPYENFPLGFNQRRLRVYFYNQFERFCFKQAREHERYWEEQIRKNPNWPPLDHLEDIRWIFEDSAQKMVYQKPWYEYHALQFLDFIEMSGKELSKYPPLAFMMISACAGQLGRLIEQYYWRFRFEGAALTGSGARKGASAGGKSKAALHQKEHSRWQMVASKVWAHRPELGKRAVAEIIRKKVGVKRTSKHIARYIRHP
jgi:hypothetical protein